MMIHVKCYKCKCASSLADHLTNNDLKNTPFEHLLTDPKFDIQEWQNRMVNEDRGKYKNGSFWCDGIKILDEYDRYMEANACPKCGSTDTCWY